MIKYPESRNTYVTREGKFYKNDRELKQQRDVHGYATVSIQFEDGTWKNCLAHRVVAITYIPNQESKPCVNHINGVKHDNRVCNLEWNTYSENTQHAFDTGLQVPPLGEEVWNAGLSNHQVHLICKTMQEGKRNKEISDIFAVARHTIKSIRAGASWSHISKLYNIPKLKREQRTSEDTVHWICSQMEKGLKNIDIVLAATSPAVTKTLVNTVRRRLSFKDISSQYKF